MILLPFMIDVGSQEVNLHLCADEQSRDGMLIDAGGFVPALAEWVARHGIRVTHILLTHLHYDHTDALPDYLQLWPDAVVVAGGALPAGKAASAKSLLVRHGDVVQVGPLRVEVVSTPGHTPDSVSYWCPDAGVCFVGDALFAGAVGGTSSDGHHDEQIRYLRSRILALPDHTELLPGHGPATTVRIEKTANPFFQPGFGRAR